MKIEFDSSKELAPLLVDTYTPPVVVPPIPAPSAWPRIAPDLFEIPLASDSVILNAKMIDGSGGYDGLGHVLHYGDLSGQIVYSNGIPDYSEKFSNPSVKPVWGKYPDGIEYLEAATDITVPLPPGYSYNRLINWNARALGVAPKPKLWMRIGAYVDPRCKRNANNQGIKLFGFGSDVPGATMGVIAEMWFVPSGRLLLGTYRYDAEVTQAQELSDFDQPLGTRDIYELHIEANTFTNGAYNRDGVFEIRVNNNTIWSRTDYMFFKTPINGQQQPGFTAAALQFYDGGTTTPSGPLMARFDSWALSSKGWIGPPL